ncbi:hypothetical protein [Erythrobacter aureus]
MVDRAEWAAQQSQGRPAARSDAIFDRMSEEVARPEGRAERRNG